MVPIVTQADCRLVSRALAFRPRSGFVSAAMTDAIPPGDPTTRDRLGRLLDYVAQVVRLDERVAFDLKEYRLTDGRPARFALADTMALPGVRHDLADEAGAGLAGGGAAAPAASRREAPDDIAAWITVPSDPGRQPDVLGRTDHHDRGRRARQTRIAAGACATSFVAMGSAAQQGEGGMVADPAPAHYRQTLCLADQPVTMQR